MLIRLKFTLLQLDKFIYRLFLRAILEPVCIEEHTKISRIGISKPARNDEPWCWFASYNSLAIRHDLNLQSLQTTLLTALQRCRCARMHLGMHSTYADLFKMCSVHDKNLELMSLFPADVTIMCVPCFYICIYRICFIFVKLKYILLNDFIKLF